MTRRGRGAVEQPLREAFQGSPHVFTTSDAAQIAYPDIKHTSGRLMLTAAALRKFAVPIGRSDHWPGRPMLWRSRRDERNGSPMTADRTRGKALS